MGISFEALYEVSRTVVLTKQVEQMFIHLCILECHILYNKASILTAIITKQYGRHRDPRAVDCVIKDFSKKKQNYDLMFMFK